LTATQTLWGALGEDALASFDHTILATNLDVKRLVKEILFDGIFPKIFVDWFSAKRSPNNRKHEIRRPYFFFSKIPADLTFLILSEPQCNGPY